MLCLNILSVYIDAKKVEEKLLAQNINIIYMNISLQMFGTDLPFPAESPDHLWFYYINNNRTFMLDGQGVTAEVVEPDIGIFGFFLLKIFVNTQNMTNPTIVSPVTVEYW